ncbi:hypothetical protein YC2023_054297 [Brassica napus]
MDLVIPNISNNRNRTDIRIRHPLNKSIINKSFTENDTHAGARVEALVFDYNRQQLMHGWIPRRLGECHSLTLSYELDLHHPLD